MSPAGFEGCIRSVDLMFDGDGIDNDCDDYVDEEAPDGLDNDKDGRLDEDTYGAQGIPGNWGPWEAWACNLDCKKMVLVRTRHCNNPPPSDGGRDCLGLKKEMLDNMTCMANIECWTDCHNFTWGKNCSRSCANCKDECNYITGECSFCRSGFKNPSWGCDKTCDVNEYGEECHSSCVDKCGADCIDRVTVGLQTDMKRTLLEPA
ncbi:unnamed protein product [Lymnaea stagnalis]|uniref:Uncharacterized protein n=1 Tax=Lymnaea stagnalis TaxID=6523 RepID=A0AAV2IRK1_LYMST